MNIVVLAGGIGGARFLRGLRSVVDRDQPGSRITVIANTGDDITLRGLRVCPDLDTIMYTLGGGIHEGQGWGRADETFVLAAEFASYGDDESWFTLGDRDLATHVLRSARLAAGQPLSAVTRQLCERWQPGVDLLPMSDQPVETHVRLGGGRVIHFQEWWVRLHAGEPATGFDFVGIDAAAPAPGVLSAIAQADAVLFAPSNPVVSIGPILAVPGMADALAAAPAPIVGLSPIVAGAPVRGMADACLSAIGRATSAAAVAELHGSRQLGSGVLDGWLVDTSDRAEVETIEALGVASRAVPLLMSDAAATESMAIAALTAARALSRPGRR